MHTKKIFYQNTYARAFEAVVLSCEPDGERFRVVLDATAFYPAGGGQPADTGCLGAANVLDVREDGDGRRFLLSKTTEERLHGIVHWTDAPLQVGASVAGTLDWERRFALMQQHTGEHIVSGLARKLYGYDNVGFHMGAAFTTMDLNGELTADEVRALERHANQAVHENVAVYARYPEPEALARIDYRSKKALSGDVRIVTVEGYDDCACCGLHCASTGEVGVIKLVQAQRYKSGMRLFMLCGMRAVDDYVRKNSDIYAISQMFSVKPEEAVAAVAQCRDENAALKRQLAEYRFDALRTKAETIAPGAQACMFESGLTPDELRRLCLLLCEKSEAACVFSSESDTDDVAVYRYAIGSFGGNAREIAARMNAALNGRGGGQDQLAQGTVKASREAIARFFSGR